MLAVHDDERVAHFVIRVTPFFFGVQPAAAAFWTGHDLFDGFFGLPLHARSVSLFHGPG